MKPVSHIKIKNGMRVNELVRQMDLAGVLGSGRLGKAVSICEAMIKDRYCRVFIGLAGPLVPGGMREIIIDMIESKWVDAVVATGATLTHDLGEALGYRHYQGTANIDDAELYKKGFDRVYESYMPNKIYEGMEDFIAHNFDSLKGKKSIKDFLWEIGRLTPKKSILKACYENKIPIFCPAISDSGIGLMMWGQLAKGKNVDVRAFEDLKEIMDIAWTAKKCGVIYFGGGVPKNYIQQAMQLAPKSASYGVQVTMDRPEPGGSSGAELREGISWGKMNPKANFVDLICDATIAMPIIYAALRERIKQKYDSKSPSSPFSR
ncbi:deoxyhypusine synthase family protein [Candidatus Woesearchaeota archaeon]|nr:deoxyhypusine synthase family protein [Candidatus Woesearchaeota archaeon]